PRGMRHATVPPQSLAAQVHYNLADPVNADKSDSTTIHLRFASSVNRQLAFVLPDPFRDSRRKPTPDTLPPGNANATYDWTLTGAQMGLSGLPYVDLVAVM